MLRHLPARLQGKSREGQRHTRSSEDAMVKLIPRPCERDKLGWRVERGNDARIWYYDTEIPRDQWEYLFHVITPNRPTMNIQEAYARAREFWDYLAEKCADEMQRSITCGVPECHLSHTWPDFHSLEREYDRFRASGKD